MTIWYYTIGTIREVERELIEKTLESLETYFETPKKIPDRKVNENQLERKVQGQILFKTETISRREIPPPKRLEKIGELYQEKKSAKTAYDKTKINREIKEEKKVFVYSDTGLNKIYDLHGNLIGRIHNSKDSASSLELGKDEYIKGFRFDFVEGPRRFGDKSEQSTYIRTTALLTDEGKKKTERYLVKLICNNSEYIPHTNPTHFHSKKIHRKTKYDLNKHKAKRELEKCQVLDTRVMGHNVHINIGGKIEIFTSCLPTINSLLVDETIALKSETRFREYTHYTKLKKWIEKTDQESNSFIGATFQNLARILGGILK